MLRIIALLVLLSSCGGGGGSSSPVNTEGTSGNNQNTIDEQCYQYETRVFRCEFTHGNLLRYYYIHQPSSRSSRLQFCIV